MVMSLPFFRKASSQLYCIELDDQKIDQHLGEIIHQVQTALKYFASHINENTLTMKEEQLTKLQEDLLPCKKDIAKLQSDLNTVYRIEKEHEQHLFIKDDQFISDKQEQLRIIIHELGEFSSILSQRPTNDDLQNQYIPKLQEQLQQTITAINKLIADDHQLQLIYQSINEL